jgi:hypothetical protein
MDWSKETFRLRAAEEAKPHKEISVSGLSWIAASDKEQAADVTYLHSFHQFHLHYFPFTCFLRFFPSGLSFASIIRMNSPPPINPE